MGCPEWVTRDERWPIRGPWLWAVSDELPQFYRELNGIDFGHALLGETLIRTQDPVRLDVLDAAVGSEFLGASERTPFFLLVGISVTF